MTASERKKLLIPKKAASGGGDSEVGQTELNLTPQGSLGGYVLKRILRQGDGLYPKEGDTISTHYVGTLGGTAKCGGGKEFDTSRRGASGGDRPFVFKLGDANFIKGWNICFATMRVGERARLTISSEYGYGDTGCPPKIPAGATLVFDVEFLGCENKALEMRGILNSRKAIARSCFDVQKSLSEINLLSIADYGNKIQYSVKQFQEAKCLMLKAASLFTPNHYNEVTSERSEGFGVCGFPLCTTGKYTTSSKKKFHISRRDQKVYDISELKQFCGVHCCLASKLFRGSLSCEGIYTRVASDRVKAQAKALEALDLLDSIKSKKQNKKTKQLTATTYVEQLNTQNTIKMIDQQTVMTKDGFCLSVEDIAKDLNRQKGDIVNNNRNNRENSFDVLKTQDETIVKKTIKTQDETKVKKTIKTEDDVISTIENALNDAANAGIMMPTPRIFPVTSPQSDFFMSTSKFTSFTLIWDTLSSWSTPETCVWPKTIKNTNKRVEFLDDNKRVELLDDKNSSHGTIGGHSAIDMQRFSILSSAVGRCISRVFPLVTLPNGCSRHALRHEVSCLCRTFMMHRPIPSMNTSQWQLVTLLLLLKCGTKLASSKRGKKGIEVLLARCKLKNDELLFLLKALYEQVEE